MYLTPQPLEIHVELGLEKGGKLRNHAYKKFAYNNLDKN